MFRRVVLFFGEWQDPIEGDLPSTKHFIPSMNFNAFTTFLNPNGYAKHIRLLELYQSEMYRGLFGTPVISREASMEVISSLVCILEHLVQIKCLDLTRTRWAILPTSIKAAIIKAADQNPNLVVQLSVSNLSPTDLVPLFSECKSLKLMESKNNEQSPLIERLPIWKNYPPKLTRLEFDSTFPGVDTLVECCPKMFSILRHFSSRGNLRGLKAAWALAQVAYHTLQRLELEVDTNCFDEVQSDHILSC